MVMKLRFSVVAIALWVDGFAQQPGTDPNEWVRNAIGNELRAEQQDTSHWKFRWRTQTADGKFEVDDVVETAQGDLKRPLIVNGRQLSPKKSDERMGKMMHDTSALEKSLKDKDDDAAKSQQLLKMFPDAFLFRYGGRNGDLLELHFSLNPKFKPPTHEAQVFHAMVGNYGSTPKGEDSGKSAAISATK